MARGEVWRWWNPGSRFPVSRRMHELILAATRISLLHAYSELKLRGRLGTTVTPTLLPEYATLPYPCLLVRFWLLLAYSRSKFYSAFISKAGGCGCAGASRRNGTSECPEDLSADVLQTAEGATPVPSVTA